jgi:Rieske Fe-S protein
MTYSALQNKTLERLAKAISLAPRFSSSIDIYFELVLDGEVVIYRITDSKIKTISDPVELVNYEAKIYRITIAASLWQSFIDNAIAFDELSFGGMFRVRQGRHGYNSNFIRLLRSLHCRELLISIETTEAPNLTYFTHTAEGEVIEVQAICPHQGYPLCGKDISGNTITCPAHNWSFDIVSGRCIRGDTSVRLDIKR